MAPRAIAPVRMAFAPGFEARVARFVREAAALRRTPREDQGAVAQRALGPSGEFAGRRRYRPGDDVRSFDWEAYARGAGLFVRLQSRDAGERWCVALDTSASMAVGAAGAAGAARGVGAAGTPAKLQLAGEFAYALCALGLAWGSEVALAAAGKVHVLRARGDLARARAELEACASAGRADFASVFAHRALSRTRRWFAIGDFLDALPERLASPAFAHRRLDAFAVQAPIELAPLEEAEGRVEWRDPESAERWTIRLGPESAAAYAAELAAHLERWRASLARGRGLLVVARAGDDFEPHLRHWLRAAP